MDMHHILNTGQTRCYNSEGHEISCPGTGHDADLQTGIPWPSDRFELQGKVVLDRLIELVWTRDANINTFPCTWQESFALIRALNREHYGGLTGDYPIATSCAA